MELKEIETYLNDRIIHLQFELEILKSLQMLVEEKEEEGKEEKKEDKEKMSEEVQNKEDKPKHDIVWSNLYDVLMKFGIDNIKGADSDMTWTLINYAAYKFKELLTGKLEELAEVLSKNLGMPYSEVLDNLNKEFGNEATIAEDKTSDEVVTMSEESRILPIYFHERLLKELRFHRMTQRDLAAKLEITQATVSNWCMGGHVRKYDQERVADALTRIFGGHGYSDYWINSMNRSSNVKLVRNK